jgi:hypothetical protein
MAFLITAVAREKIISQPGVKVVIAPHPIPLEANPALEAKLEECVVWII